MDIEMKSEKILIKKEKLSVNIEQLIENDISLADYYGDIVKILGCSGTANIFSANVISDKAVIDGNIVIRITYTDAQGKTEILENAIPFNRSIDIKNASDNDNITAVCIGEQINCRAINPRRAEIRGSATLHICVSGTEEKTYISAVPDGFCHTLGSHHEGWLLQGSAIKNFSLTAECEPDEKYNGAKLSRMSFMPVISEIKTIRNKMMIKGSITTSLVCIDKNGNYINDRIATPVNQIIELDGTDENSMCCVALKIISAEGRITPETPQSASFPEIPLIVSAEIDVFSKGELCPVDEAYSCTHELSCDETKIRFISDIRKINENYPVSSDFEFSSHNIEKTEDISVKRIKYKCRKENAELIINGTINYGIIASTKENEKLYFERIADFELKKPLHDAVSEIQPVINIHLNALTFSHKSNSAVTVTAELHTEGFIYSYSNVNVISSIEKTNELRRKTSDSVVTVYFASEGERLWDIAKEHHTGIENIRQLNSINTNFIEKDCMLIFEQE